MLKTDPDVASWSTYVGRGAIRFYLPLAVELPNDFFAQAVVIAKDVAARERLHDAARDGPCRTIPQRGRARVAARAWAAGRLAGAVSCQRSGPDAGARHRIAVAGIVAGDADARHVNFDWMEPARMVRINIDQDQARLLGLSSQALAPC